MAARVAFTFLIGVAIAACATASTPDPIAEYWRITDINKDQAIVLGKRIRVHGYLTLEFENLNLWTSRAAERRFDCRRGVGVDRKNAPEAYEFNRSMVEITGTAIPLCGQETFHDPDLLCISTGHCGDIVIVIETIKPTS